VPTLKLGKERSMPAGPMISVIDDDESMLSAIVALVRCDGYDAHGFSSADEFLRSGKLASSACIITDVHMPGMSGIELKQHLAARECRVPVIMITALRDPGLEATALTSGAASFLRKPFDAGTLIGCIKSALAN
jgi:FixJ family two-component response regulator